MYFDVHPVCMVSKIVHVIILYYDQNFNINQLIIWLSFIDAKVASSVLFGYESCLSHKYEKPTLIREKKTRQLSHIVKIRETYSNLRNNESTIVFNCSKILYHLRSSVIQAPLAGCTSVLLKQLSYIHGVQGYHNF